MADPGCWGSHLAVIVARRRWQDLFAKTYWVRCWDCALRLGPFPDRGFALFVAVNFT